MKKIKNLITKLSVCLLLLAVFGCADTDVDPLFDQTINERTKELITEYSSVLNSPENGWIGYYSPNENFGAYTMLLNFDDEGNVSIKSDYVANSESNTITYRLDKTLKIEVVFESSSVFSDIFSLYDNDNDGEFVFNILSATEDEVVLQSKLDYGDDVTIFTLHPATVADLDLEPISGSLENIAGDGTQSVFRNILYNNEVIAEFDFNSTTRLSTVSYLDESGELVEVSGPIAITVEGFYFITPVDVNGVVLTSFIFDETNIEYNNEVDNQKIIYDNVPGIPLEEYVFGSGKVSLRNNYFDPDRTSVAFYNLWDETAANFSKNNGGRTIYRFYLRNVLPDATGDPYLSIDYFSGDTSYSMYFYMEKEIVDGKMFFQLTGEVSSNAASRGDSVLELVDVLVGSASGYYLKDAGTITGYTNKTVTFINADNPQYAINYYEF